MSLSNLLSLLAIPGFMILLGIEYFLAKRKGIATLDLEDSVNNLSIGIFERFCTLISLPLTLQLFDYVSSHVGLFNFEWNWKTWILLFFLTDFLWYWYHRLSHEINIFWAAHVVHHSSEHYNFTVAARITIFQQLIRIPFWIALPVLGFNSYQIFSMLVIHAAYQLFLHTQLIGKLGWLETVLVTPSHHRVHHGRNPQYMDKNYGGILIFWDKIFGTFEVENEAVEFGIPEPLKTKSFLWTHFHFVVDIVVSSFYATGIINKLNAIIGRPIHYKRTNSSFASLENKLIERRKSDAHKMNLNLLLYIGLQLAFVLGISFYFQFFGFTFSFFNTLVFLVLLITLINCCALLEKKHWIIYLEYSRLVILCIQLIWVFPNSYVIVLSASIPLLVLLLFEQIKGTLFSVLYNYKKV